MSCPTIASAAQRIWLVYCKNVTCESHERDVDEKWLSSVRRKYSWAPASEEALGRQVL